MIYIVSATKEEFTPSQYLDRFNLQYIYTGIGCTNALLELSELESKYKQFNSGDLVINVGSVGSVKENVGKCIRTRIFQKQIHESEYPYQLKIHTIPSIVSDDYKCDDNYYVRTVDSFAEGIVDSPNRLIDMESYALAAYFSMRGISFFAIKYVTDDGVFSDWKDSLNTCNQMLNADLLNFMNDFIVCK